MIGVKHVQIRLTPAEHEALTQLANEQGIGLQELGRRVLLSLTARPTEGLAVSGLYDDDMAMAARIFRSDNPHAIQILRSAIALALSGLPAADEGDTQPK